MNRQEVEKTIAEYLKPIFGFALKRCKNVHDAEDLSQEIVTRAFRALLAKDDVADMGKFIWTVAHNVLSNYYRDAAKSVANVSVDEIAELIADPYADTDAEDNRDAIHRLRTEIAYLSKQQRKIVMRITLRIVSRQILQRSWEALRVLSNGTCLRQKKN